MMNHTKFAAAALTPEESRLEQIIAQRLAQSDYDIASEQLIDAAHAHGQAKLRLELKKAEFEMAKAKLVRLTATNIQEGPQ